MIRSGCTVVIRDHGKKRTGRALHKTHGGWMLDDGRTATASNTIKVTGCPLSGTSRRKRRRKRR